MLTRVGDEHMGRFVREALARRGRRRQRGADRSRSGSRASCCSASRVRKASRTFSTARTAPTWASSPADVDAAPFAAARRSQSPARTCPPNRRARGVAPRHRAREAARPPGRARRRLPAGALGPRRPRRRRRARAGLGRRSRGRCRHSCPTATSSSAPRRKSASPAAARARSRRCARSARRTRRDDRHEARRRRLRGVRGRDPGERRPGPRRRRIPGRGAERPRRRRRIPVRLPERLDREPARRALRPARQRGRRHRRHAPRLHAGHADARGARRVPRPRRRRRRGRTRTRASRRCTARPAVRPLAGDLCILAFDHRRQLEQIAAAAARTTRGSRTSRRWSPRRCWRSPPRRIPASSLGAIVDGRHGGKALARLNASGAWIGRPVELPASRPLEFESTGGIGLELLQWPRHHVVKCLVNYHPADPVELRLAQEARLAELAHATAIARARTPGRSHLLRTRAHGRCRHDARRDAAALSPRPAARPGGSSRRSPPRPGARSRTIVAGDDPLCHGALLLGLDASEEQVAQSFEVAARHPVCRGFAIGRTIFGAPARDWLAGTHRRRNGHRAHRARATRA